MKSFLAIISLFTISILTSCEPIDPNKQIDEGNVQGNIYTSQEIGWAIEIPSGWEVIKKEQVQANNEKGLKAIEETIEGKVAWA